MAASSSSSKQRQREEQIVQKKKRQRQNQEEAVGEEVVQLGDSWSDLPYDLVGRILSCCRSSGDRVRLAAVCTPWRRAVTLANANIADCISHLPWLLLPRHPSSTSKKSSPPSSQQALYSFSERRLYPVTNPLLDLQQEDFLRQGAPMRCVGSGVGWMITISDFTADLQLHDTVTNSVTPSLPSLPSPTSAHSGSMTKKV